LTDPITILLADDHQVVRQGLRAVLGAEPGFSVVGEAADGLEAVALVERLGPQVLVVDIAMPGLGGLDVVREVARRSPRTRTVVLSMHGDEANVLAALREGALGFVLKEASAAELARAVREAAAGRRYLSPPLTDHAIEAYARRSASDSPADPYDSLTTREREVLQLVAEGLTSAQAAERLNVSPRTAEHHRASVLKKLGLHGTADLARYAAERGLLPPRPHRQ
jgi:two-component system, NarL family, response regulator NreC